MAKTRPWGGNAMTILLERGRLLCAIIPFFSNIDPIGRLRFKEFVEKLGWVTGNPEEKKETDGYDPWAIHLAVSSKDSPDRIISYMRIIAADSSCGMMLTQEECFRKLLPKNFILPPRSVELSRFCVEPDFQKTATGGKAISLLFNSVLEYMRREDFGILFALADDEDERGYSHNSFLRKHLPSFKEEGRGQVRENRQVATYVLSLTREGLEKDLSR